MNLGEIVTEVRMNLKDQRADVLASIQEYVNESYLWIAAETSLPSLKMLFTVTTVVSQAYAVMPTTFDGRLLYCGNSTGKFRILTGGIEHMLELHPDITEEGEVEDVVSEGNILWYAKIPTDATVLTCLGYNKPTLLTDDTDTPSAVPDYLHREILVNKATSIGYSVIEEGLEGERPNTSFYLGQALAGKIKLETWVDKRKGHLPRDVWSV